MWAAYRGYYDVVRLLLEHGADIHTKNKYGQLQIITKYLYF